LKKIPESILINNHSSCFQNKNIAGQVIEGHETIDKLYKGYGDIPPFGPGPDQGKLHNQVVFHGGFWLF
jgi:hypothetical protein